MAIRRWIRWMTAFLPTIGQPTILHIVTYSTETTVVTWTSTFTLVSWE
jgi:hypothetical protein